MNEAYHYTESGLDNVYLYNVSLVKDINNEKVIYIPKINKLHKVIAKGIISKKGLINDKEIRFLRTEMGLKQAEFSELLGKEAQACGRWERNETKIDKTIDTLIRFLVSEYLGETADIVRISKLNSLDVANDNINIDGNNNNYILMAA